MIDICSNFPVTATEYEELDKKFGKLTEYASWALIKNNSHNSHTDDQQDISQELKIALIRAGSYYKRQIYVEKCLNICKKNIENKKDIEKLKELKKLWKNKTRHGANKQKFGPIQEKILEDLLLKLPSKIRPSKTEPLKIDAKFTTYCKAITWNAQKCMGKKITKEKSFRNKQVSLSEFDYLGGNF